MSKLKIESQVDKYITIHVKRQPHRNEAQFYYGKHILTGEVAGKKIIVESAGEMRATLPNEERLTFSGDDLLRQLNERGYKDRQLEYLVWDLNNWFRIIDEDGEDDIAIVNTYDDALNTLKNIVRKRLHEQY
jgi:hypothetical protein